MSLVMLIRVDPTKKMSKSAGEKHVLYLFDEDYSNKLRKANMNEEGLKNIRIIAETLGVDSSKYEKNLELKEAVASKMSGIFK